MAKKISVLLEKYQGMVNEEDVALDLPGVSDTGITKVDVTGNDDGLDVDTSGNDLSDIEGISADSSDGITNDAQEVELPTGTEITEAEGDEDEESEGDEEPLDLDAEGSEEDAELDSVEQDADDYLAGDTAEGDSEMDDIDALLGNIDDVLRDALENPELNVSVEIDHSAEGAGEGGEEAELPVDDLEGEPEFGGDDAALGVEELPADDESEEDELPF